MCVLGFLYFSQINILYPWIWEVGRLSRCFPSLAHFLSGTFLGPGGCSFSPICFTYRTALSDSRLHVMNSVPAPSHLAWATASVHSVFFVKISDSPSYYQADLLVQLIYRFNFTVVGYFLVGVSHSILCSHIHLKSLFYSFPYYC